MEILTSRRRFPKTSQRGWGMRTSSTVTDVRDTLKIQRYVIELFDITLLQWFMHIKTRKHCGSTVQGACTGPWTPSSLWSWLHLDVRRPSEEYFIRPVGLAYTSGMRGGCTMQNHSKPWMKYKPFMLSCIFFLRRFKVVPVSLVLLSRFNDCLCDNARHEWWDPFAHDTMRVLNFGAARFPSLNRQCQELP